MARRFWLKLALLAVLGTTSLQAVDYDLLERFQDGLASKPILVDVGDEVGFTCTDRRYPLWAFSKNGDFGVRDISNRFYIIKNFSANDVGNYQCEVNVGGNLRWGNVLLCASNSATGPRKCRDEEIAPRRLVKFGLLNNHHASDERSKLRFARLKNNQTSLVTIAANESFKLRCAVETKALTEFLWFINRRLELEEIDKYKRFSQTLTEIVAKDEAEYECIARTNARTCINHVFQIRINTAFPRKPFIDEGFMENHTKLPDTDVTFYCGMYVNSSMYVTWVKSNDYLGYDDEYIFHREIVQNPNANNPTTLTLSNLTRGDEGWYSCFVVDPTRSRFRSRYLKIQSDDVETSDEEEEPDSSEGLSVVAWCLVCTVLIVVIGGIYYVARTRWFRRTKASNRCHLMKRIEISWQSLAEDEENYQERPQMPEVRITRVKPSENDYVNCIQGYDSDYLVPRDNPWELSRKRLQMGKVLGEGAFGRVMQARFTDSTTGICSIVAVKMLKDKHADEEVVNLISELEIMKVIGKHPNIVNLIGSCTQGGPLYVVIEYAKHGNLRDFLRARSPQFKDVRKLEEPVSLTSENLICFANQIAMGMAHLTSKRCIHRDLAARNVLVDDNYVMKIADFGLARNVCGNDYYKKETHGRLPVKWMAPEALLLNKYTAKSDVWSYGILLWELMTFGGSPYPSVPSPENLYKMLKSGFRMEQPDHCPSEIYKLMQGCWIEEPSDRPTFLEIVQFLSSLASSGVADENFTQLSNERVNRPSSSAEC